MTDSEMQDGLAETPDPADAQPLAEAKPALTIHIQSWATPVVGLVMLLIGLVAGFYAYPLVQGRLDSGPVAAAGVPTSAAPAASAPQPAGDADTAASQAELMEFVVGQTNHFIGSPDAPVTLIEFSDFQWPYCGTFATGAWRQIYEEYVVTGKVRFGYIHLAFLGAASNLSAEASECAAEQNKFWEYHDLLFSGFAGGNRPAYTAANLKKWAGELDLNQADFDACLDSEKYTELVATQTSTFQSIGVSSTPSFILNGKPLVGALPYESFKQAIDAELNAK